MLLFVPSNIGGPVVFFELTPWFHDFFWCWAFGKEQLVSQLVLSPWFRWAWQTGEVYPSWPPWIAGKDTIPSQNWRVNGWALKTGVPGGKEVYPASGGKWWKKKLEGEQCNMTIVFLYFLWIWNLAYIPAHRWTQYILITHIIYL